MYTEKQSEIKTFVPKAFEVNLPVVPKQVTEEPNKKNRSLFSTEWNENFFFNGATLSLS